jgi:hypothetical protein
MNDERYPTEILGEWDDDGTMPSNVEQLRNAVVGHRIVSVVKASSGWDATITITLDNGKKVEMTNGRDCCAYTELEAFLLNPELVDHGIMGVGTTDGYTTWHIYADGGDILKLTVNWGPGNPFYYGYGFYIRVKEIEDE